MNWKIQSENKFTHLLVVLFIFFTISPFMASIDPKVPLTSFMFLATIVFTIRALNLKKTLFKIYVALGGSLFLLDLCLTIANGEPHRVLGIITLFLYAMFLAVAILLMLHQMFKTEKVTGDIVRGGISVYLLLGYLWAVFYYIIFSFDKEAFYFNSNWDSIYLFYYSFTTLTTLGYGDVYPLNKFAMVLSSLEALVGQIYIGVFVARLVGLHIIHHQRHEHSS